MGGVVLQTRRAELERGAGAAAPRLLRQREPVALGPAPQPAIHAIVTALEFRNLFGVSTNAITPFFDIVVIVIKWTD